MLRIVYASSIVVLTATAWAFESYVYTYIVIVGVLVFQVLAFKNITHRLLAGIFLVYLAIALLNVSTYRNNISVETANIYLVAVACIFIPLILVSGVSRHDDYELQPSNLTNLLIAGHLAIAWIALVYVYVRFGVVVVQQDERFGIPTALGYAIRSAQFVPAYMVICRSFRDFPLGFWTTAMLSISPSILIASRSTAVLAVLAIVIIVLALNSYQWSRPTFTSSLSSNVRLSTPVVLSVLVAISFAFIGGGFYIRRAYSSGLMDGSQYVEQYLDSMPRPVAYIIAPFQQGFNETTALTSRVVDYGITNNFTDVPLLWADFANLLGTDDTAAAQYFGDYIGRAQAGGLTPGLVGGVLLDFPQTYVLWFLALGVLTAALYRKSLSDRRFLCLYAIFLTQLVHLLQRGFLKPEYITILIITAIYLATLQRVARDETN